MPVVVICNEFINETLTSAANKQIHTHIYTSED